MHRVLASILLYAAVFSPLQGKVVETAHFKEITEHVSPHTLIILDIDDTLIVPVQMLGNDEWFSHRKADWAAMGLSTERALDKALAEWEAIRHLTAMELVEEGIDRTIGELQSKGYKVIGLSTQGLGLATRTVNQLQDLRIDLSKTALGGGEEDYFNNGHGVLYRKGILFTAGTHKGTAFTRLLDRLGYTPASVVFINDKAMNLEEVRKAVESRGWKFTGLRYSYSDARKASYQHEIALIQFTRSSFDRILTDNEARQLLDNER